MLHTVFSCVFQVPSVMVLQMPRFGQQKMFKRIFIDPVLDLSPVLQDIPHQCEVCNKPALMQCLQCACDSFGPTKVTVYFCSECESLIHSNPARKEHKVISLNEHVECTDTSRNKLELFAVVSITTSHYVSFVKCGDQEHSEWVFFDSMADRHGKFMRDGYLKILIAENKMLIHNFIFILSWNHTVFLFSNEFSVYTIIYFIKIGSFTLKLSI